MRKLLVVLNMILIGLSLPAQNNSVTNNNTITINGNVYYFQPSNTPSSPPPSTGRDFISVGDWYGENAARAWASIVNWVIEHSSDSTEPIRAGFTDYTGSRTREIKAGDRIYISAIHAYHVEADRYGLAIKGSAFTRYTEHTYHTDHAHEIRIDYWIVSQNSRMEDGWRATRWFKF